MNEPCIECICLPICKGEVLMNLYNKCDLLKDYTIDIARNVPRDSYRYIQMHALDKTYEIQKNRIGECVWIWR